ncbi:MAG: NAD(P)H-dependent oxidoreductase subunit E [Deltaproteobacteria bacterium]|nr:NAD(P)H-dependent oxidoreductase subunit E [Deltaproteobacteria bacterium]
MLLKIQEAIGYLPRHAIQSMAEFAGLTESNVYGVATFYNRFRFVPPGRHHIQVCLGTACHVKGGEIVLQSFERNLGIDEGGVTPDREASLERVACVGCCTLAPVVVMDGKVEGKVSPTKVDGITLKIKMEKEKMAKEEGAGEGGGRPLSGEQQA